MKILKRIGLALGLTDEPEADSTTLIIEDDVDVQPTAGHISILPSTPPTVGHSGAETPTGASGPLVDALRALVNALEPEVRRAVIPEIPATIAAQAIPETTATPAADDAEVKRLKSELEQAQLSAGRQRRALTDRINDLQSQVSLLEEKNERMAAAAARHPAEEDALEQIKQLEAQAKKLTAENQRLATLNEQLDAKSRIADKMMSDLQSAASTARKEADELRSRVADIDEIHTKFEQVEAAIAKKNERIDELSKQLEERVYNQTYSENKLRRRIKQLEDELTAAGGDPEARGRGRRRRRDKEAPQEAPAPVSPDNDPDSQLSLF